MFRDVKEFESSVGVMLNKDEEKDGLLPLKVLCLL